MVNDTLSIDVGSGVHNESNSTMTNYLDEADCIPNCSVNNTLYCITQNAYGSLTPMTCTYDETFGYPRIVHSQTLNFTVNNVQLPAVLTQFDCCRTKTVGPFIKDTAFNATVWPQLVVSFVAIIVSTILVLGLVIPMIKKIHNRSCARNNDALTLPRRPHTNKNNNDNVYNFYLVLLAIPDLTLNFFVIGLYSAYVCQYYNERFAGYVVIALREDGVNYPLDTAWIYGTSASNIWMNGIVAYEIYRLLDCSHRRIKVTPPTIRRASIQAAVIYVYGLITFVVHYNLDGIINTKIFAGVSFMLSAGMPLLYVSYVCFVIWYRGLIPKTTLVGGPRTNESAASTNGLRELSLYFFRIILVFLIVWVPAMVLMVLSGPVRSRDPHKYAEEELKDFCNPILYSIGLLLCSFQSIVSFGISLTKTYVRRSVLDLLCLKHYFCSCSNKRNDDSQQHNSEV